MARDKLKDFLQGRSTETRIAFTIDAADMGPTDTFNAGDDLGRDPGTRQELLGLENPESDDGLLGDFLKFLVDLSDNQFTLKGGNMIANSTNRGDALTPIDQQGVVEGFVEGVDRIRASRPGGSSGESLGSIMSSYSESGYIDKQVINDEVDKIGFDTVPIQSENLETPRSGQTLLGTIVGENIDHTGQTRYGSEPESKIQEAIEDTLVQNSRFRNVSGDRFSSFVAPDDKSASRFEEGVSFKSSELGSPDGTLTYQRNFGEYLVDPGSDPGGSDPVRIAQLMSVGESLLLKGAGWDDGISPGDSSDPSDIDASEAAKKFTSGEFTGGEESFKVDNETIRARNAKGAPENEMGDSVYAGRGQFLSADGAGDSFGSTTTPRSKFSSTDNQSILRAQAAAAIAAMITITEDTFNMMDSAGGGDNLLDLRRGPYVAGQAKRIAREAKFQLFRNLVIAPTDYDYKRCVKQGFLILFNRGFSDGENSLSKTANYQMIQESAGFWLSVAKKILISYATILDNIGSDGAESFTSPTVSNVASIFRGISKTPVLRILNVAAIVGNVSLRAQGAGLYDDEGESDGMPNPNDPVGPWNVDILPDGPATRISKSRTQDGQTALSLAWRTSSTPAIYMIPRNVIMAAVEMGTLSNGTNPLKGMMGSQLIKKTYLDVNAGTGGLGFGGGVMGGGGSPRIPGDVIERIENLLDAEYVPFYFHDIRTNEIISFHAFLENLTDRYTPEYSRTNGYGRIDSVKTYRSTNRSIQFSFHIAATSKEDFDEMWWKINKLTTLVYPQWTRGTLMSTKAGLLDSTFIQPFSQVLSSSPVIRLRIGDVIKGNYSKFNLARIFGVGDSDVIPKASSMVPPTAFMSIIHGAIKGAAEAQLDTVFAAIYGSPLSFGADMGGIRPLRALASQALINGFANPLGVSIVMRELSSPDQDVNPASFSLTLAGAVQAGATALRGLVSPAAGYGPTTFPYLKASSDEGYIRDDGTGKRWRVLRPLRVFVIAHLRKTEVVKTLSDAQVGAPFKGPRRKANPLLKTHYRVAIVDFNAPIELLGRWFIVSHADLMPNINAIFNSYVLPSLSAPALADAVVQGLANEAATITGIPADQLDVAISDTANFMKASTGFGPATTTVNPVTKAFASTAGRGLAGVITNLSYNLLDGTNTWEIDWNSRAPKVVKVDIGFEPIHDIPPGLDHNGYNRAPIYNVGDIMQYVAGDPYDDDGRASHDSYKNQGRLGTVSEDPNDTSAAPSGGSAAARETASREDG